MLCDVIYFFNKPPYSPKNMIYLLLNPLNNVIMKTDIGGFQPHQNGCINSKTGV
jgi:hypothetical protein